MADTKTAPAAAKGAPAKAAKPAAKPAAAADAAAADAKPRKARQQIAVALGLDIPPARCIAHFRKNLSDPQVEAKIKKLRSESKAAKEAGDVARVAEIKEELKLDELKQLRTSNEIPASLGALADYAIKELLGHGMDQTIAAGTTLMRVEHIHAPSVSGCLTHPLFQNLPEWKNYSVENEAKLEAAHAAEAKARRESKAKQQELDIAKAPTVTAPDGKKIALVFKTTKAAAHADGDSDGEDDTHGPDKTRFKTYVENSIKEIRKDEKYLKIRMSSRIRDHCSTLITQLLEHLATLCEVAMKIDVDHATGTLVSEVRTLTTGQLLSVVHTILIDNGKSEKLIKPLTDRVMLVMKRHETKTKESREKKEENMTPAAKAKAAATKAEKAFAAAEKSAKRLAEKSAEEAEKSAKLTESLADLKQKAESAEKLAADLKPAEAAAPKAAAAKPAAKPAAKGAVKGAAKGAAKPAAAAKS